MPRDWTDLFVLPDGEAPPANADGEEQEGGRGRGRFFRRLRDNLSKTRQALGAEIQATLFETVDEDTWERLEEALIMADVGASTTAKVVAQLEEEAREGGLEGGEALSARLTELLAGIARTEQPVEIDLGPEPTVIMAVGVNGTGKTTTIGKLAWHLQRELGRTVLLGAADTFRAAAVEQLQGWARRAGCEVVTGREGADPGSVAFEAVRRGREQCVDVVIIDTAGRLHTSDALLDEMRKIHRVIGKRLPGAPHETLLVLDGTIGQNAIAQATTFSAAVPVTGIVMNKVDGSARGGIVVAVHQALDVPVKFLGVGEKLDDLIPFDPAEFAREVIGD